MGGSHAVRKPAAQRAEVALLPCATILFLPDRRSLERAEAHRARRRREERAIIMCDRVIEIVGGLLQVPGRELRRTGRCAAEISRARQIAMYVAHVRLHMTMREVGIGFCRHRTLVTYACHLVEDMRDDLDFDRLVSLVERLVDAAFAELE